MGKFEKDIKLLIVAVLKQNAYTAEQPIQVHVRGRNVLLTGSVANEDLVYEAVVTAESVSELLRVYHRLQVVDPAAPKMAAVAGA
jgi:osmotically-inducible protein OsmY